MPTAASSNGSKIQPDTYLHQLASQLIDGWDPPAAMLHPTEEMKHKIRCRVKISAIEFEGKGGGSTSRTELDSHANFCVVGRHCYIISRSGKTVDVAAFSESAGGLNAVPIIDCILAYDCPLTNQVYLLVLRNALYVESMEENLISPFILREAGLEVNECAKQHCKNREATDEDHTIISREIGLRIPMDIRSTFSYFITRKPSEDEIDIGVPCFITPNAAEWDPTDDCYAENERNLKNWKGEVHPPMYEKLELIVEEDYRSIASLLVEPGKVVNRNDPEAMVSAMGVQDVSIEDPSDRADIIATANVAASALKPFGFEEREFYDPMPVGQDQVGTILSSVSNTLDPVYFADALVNNAAASHLKMSVGATSALPPDDDDNLWCDEPCFITIDMNDLDGMEDDIEAQISATGGKAKGVSPEHLSKIWSIDLETAKRTIEITEQRLKHEPSDYLKRRYSTNDRMLRYKRINTHFYMDTFFATRKAKSYRGNTCMQLFVSDTGFIYVYPM